MGYQKRYNKVKMVIIHISKIINLIKKYKYMYVLYAKVSSLLKQLELKLLVQMSCPLLKPCKLKLTLVARVEEEIKKEGEGKGEGS